MIHPRQTQFKDRRHVIRQSLAAQNPSVLKETGEQL